jgi:pyruvate formate lyase activating enzyme
MLFKVPRRLKQLCRGCGFCDLKIACPGEANCTSCGACVVACPYSARVLEEIEEGEGTVQIKVNGRTHAVPKRLTVLKALEFLGYRVSRLPDKGDIFAPCRTGGCWACAVIVNGELKPSCITPVRGGMSISTERASIERLEPLRLVSGFQGHTVGGVGTPHWLKPKGFWGEYVEAACFAHGCILRCPTCQNWEITYSSVEAPMTPMHAAELMTQVRRRYGVDRMAISGGEPTLNRRWLLEYLRELRRLNQDEKARLHVDTNAVLLTPEYIDDLVEAGMTDIGADVKSLEPKTFTRITGIEDKDLARELLRTEWDAIRYLLDNYMSKVFIGIGIPYNPKLISLNEVSRMGERIAGWEPDVQVCVLDYRPEFRRWDIQKPGYREMLEVKWVLEDRGLNCVIVQTERGHVGPGPA